MIWESSYWKDDLLNLAEYFKSRVKARRWNERSLITLEKKVFISMYVIRKLIEAKKLSNRIVGMEFSLSSYMPTGKAITLTNWNKIDKLYDLSKSVRQKRNLLFVCNQIIHSYIFIPQIDEAKCRLSGFYFSSDR